MTTLTAKLRTTVSRPSYRTAAAIVLLAAVFVALVAVAYTLTISPDWPLIFRPAVGALFGGHSPYSIPGYYNPPWLLLFLSPLAILPERLGAALLGVLSFAAFVTIAYRMGARGTVLVLLALVPHNLYNLIKPNIDFIAAVGFVLPPQIGLLFVLIKPQIGIALAAYWLIVSWRKGGVKEVIRVFSPVSLAFLLSFALYGFWPASFAGVIGEWWNISLWPYSLVIGLVLLAAAVRQDKPGLSICASPFFSPYLGIGSLPYMILGLLPSRAETLAAVAGLWLMQVVTGRPF